MGSIATSSSASDCAKAKSKLEKFICGDPAIEKADAEMSKAYYDLIAKVKDREFHEAIVMSQRRWLKKRLPGGKIWAASDRYLETTVVLPEIKEFIITASQDRATFLRSKNLLPDLLEQRHIRHQDGAGPNAGYNIGCMFLEPPWGAYNQYYCSGSFSRQKNDRICTISEAWASGRTTIYRTVQKISGHKIIDAAVCKYGFEENSCPGIEDVEDPHWTLKPLDGFDSIQIEPRKLLKYDLDFSLSEEDSQWMDTCLKAAIYPPANEAHRAQE